MMIFTIQRAHFSGSGTCTPLHVVCSQILLAKVYKSCYEYHYMCLQLGALSACLFFPSKLQQALQKLECNVCNCFLILLYVPVIGMFSQGQRCRCSADAVGHGRPGGVWCYHKGLLQRWSQCT